MIFSNFFSAVAFFADFFQSPILREKKVNGVEGVKPLFKGNFLTCPIHKLRN
jgi:hypothetical protein